ncbi:hypothetical protein [Dietzia aurantiaca]|uniref:DUF2569 family protein n=1 Tax=Dietzia aurantiaca TaxID=983873 RepID=A0ABV9PTE5_9ACTN
MTSSGPWRPPAPDDIGGSGPAAGPGGEAEPDRPSSPPPEEIRAAWGLWLAAAVFALAGMLLNAATARLTDLPVATQGAFRDAVDNAGTTDISIDSLFQLALAVGAVFALLAAALTVWLAFRLRAGRGWARTMLNLIAIFLVIDAVSVVIGVFGGVAGAGERDEVVSFVVVALQILAGLCAATAVWRQHTAEALAYTKADRGPRVGK